MSHVCCDEVRDVERNVHYRTLAQIIRCDNSGVSTGLGKVAVAVSYKSRIEVNRGHMINSRDKLKPYSQKPFTQN